MRELVVALERAQQRAEFGGKATQLGACLAAGLPVPTGLALSAAGVRAALNRDRLVLDQIEWTFGDGPVAVRSSGLDEDGAQASFAGAHQSLLGQRGLAMILAALDAVQRSGRTEAALAYRRGLGLSESTEMAAVLQHMVAADVAGVMFTRNPVTDRDERVIEASWGLGESVVAGLVTPDHYRLEPGGRLIERTLGEKDLSIVLAPDGGTHEVAEARLAEFCLTPSQLRSLDRLAGACDQGFGTSRHDIEFAFCDESVYLLQRRPITRG